MCTEAACTPDCDHHPAGRLCLVGEWDGGPTEYFKVGAPLLAQIEPVECVSAWCNDKRIATCSIVSDPGATDFTVIGDFCTQFVDRMLCDDCGAFSATCDAPALTAGTYSIRLADSPLSLERTVPSAVPPSSYCVELPR